MSRRFPRRSFLAHPRHSYLQADHTDARWGPTPARSTQPNEAQGGTRETHERCSCGKPVSLSTSNDRPLHMRYAVFHLANGINLTLHHEGLDIEDRDQDGHAFDTFVLEFIDIQAPLAVLLRVVNGRFPKQTATPNVPVRLALGKRTGVGKSMHQGAESQAYEESILPRGSFACARDCPVRCQSVSWISTP